jgi:hypothetical protein
MRASFVAVLLVALPLSASLAQMPMRPPELKLYVPNELPKTFVESRPNATVSGNRMRIRPASKRVIPPPVRHCPMPIAKLDSVAVPRMPVTTPSTAHSPMPVTRDGCENPLRK